MSLEHVMSRTAGLSVGFILAPGFTMVAFVAFVDTLRLAADEGDRSRPIHCRWSILSHNMQPIRASCGIEITPTTELPDPRGFDYIIVVGGLLTAPRLDPSLCAYLKLANERKVALVGLCTGGFTLARLGLMDGYRTCVSWFHCGEFASEFPHLQVISDELYVVDRDRLTCAGGTSVVHLAAFLVERHNSKGQAAKALRILIENALQSERALQPQPLFTEETENLRVRKAMLLIERNLSTPLSTEFIARHVSISDRHLERLFLAEIGISPSTFALKLRLSNAYRLLETTRNSIIDIAVQCGFQSSSHFSRSFRGAHGMSPSQVRKQVCHGAA